MLASEKMPPPVSVAELPLRVEFMTDISYPLADRAPPWAAAVFRLKVESAIDRGIPAPWNPSLIAPPLSLAELPENTESVMLAPMAPGSSWRSTSMAPPDAPGPLFAAPEWLPEKVEPLMVTDSG